MLNGTSRVLAKVNNSRHEYTQWQCLGGDLPLQFDFEFDLGPVCRVWHFSTRSPVCKEKTSGVPMCTNNFWCALIKLLSSAVKIWVICIIIIAQDHDLPCANPIDLLQRININVCLLCNSKRLILLNNFVVLHPVTPT